MVVVAAEQVNALNAQLFIKTGLTEELLAAAYLLLQRDGLLDTVWYNGAPGLSDFLRWHRDKDKLYLGAFVRPTLDAGDSELHLAGLGWLWSIQGPPGGRKAEVGFAYLKEHHGTRIPEELTRQMIQYCFDDLEMDALYGTTPEPNKLAIRFSKRLGFSQVGPLPAYCTWHGQPCGAIISYMSRAQWEQQGKGA